METSQPRKPALDPEDLARLFIQYANAGDVDGLVSLYEPDAVIATPAGPPVVGAQAIRAFYSQLLAARPKFQGGQQRPALRRGNLALTSSRLTTGGVTAEVARQQPDGTWRWIIDQPAIAREA